MTDDANNIAPRKQRSDVGRAHFKVTPERKARYIEGLRKSGSHRFAAMHATAAGTACTESGKAGFAYDTFRKERKIDPEFAAACTEAVSEALGRLEESIMERAFQPDVRENFDPKTGKLTGRAEAWEPANRLARAILARHDSDWVELQKRQIESSVTINGAGNGQGGIGFVITPQLTANLTDDERLQLSVLMRSMVERHEKQLEQKQLPGGSEQE
jgi:hypothetical protein